MSHSEQASTGAQRMLTLLSGGGRRREKEPTEREHGQAADEMMTNHRTIKGAHGVKVNVPKGFTSFSER